MNSETETLILELAEMLKARGWMCATAESCTGGLIGAALTSVSGSSEWYLGGVISYANSVKVGLLGVSEEDLAAQGAVGRAEQEAVGAVRDGDGLTVHADGGGREIGIIQHAEGVVIALEHLAAQREQLLAFLREDVRLLAQQGAQGVIVIREARVGDEGAERFLRQGGQLRRQKRDAAGQRDL